MIKIVENYLKMAVAKNADNSCSMIKILKFVHKLIISGYAYIVQERMTTVTYALMDLFWILMVFVYKEIFKNAFNILRIIFAQDVIAFTI